MCLPARAQAMLTIPTRTMRRSRPLRLPLTTAVAPCTGEHHGPSQAAAAAAAAAAADNGLPTSSLEDSDTASVLTLRHWTMSARRWSDKASVAFVSAIIFSAMAYDVFGSGQPCHQTGSINFLMVAGPLPLLSGACIAMEI